MRSKLKPEIDATAVQPAEGMNAGASGAFVVSPSGIESSAQVLSEAPANLRRNFCRDLTTRGGPRVIQPAPSPALDSSPGLSTGRLFTYSADGKMLGRRQDSVTEITGGKSAKSPNRSDTAELANLLRSSSPQPETKPSHTTSPEIAIAKPDASDAGEFTNFFQGPFDGEKPSATPELSPLSQTQNKLGTLLDYSVR